MTEDRSVFEKVRRILMDTLGADEEAISPSVSFQDLGADSLDLVEMIMAFEEAFDLTISDEDAEKIATVQDVVDYIEAKRAKVTSS